MRRRSFLLAAAVLCLVLSTAVAPASPPTPQDVANSVTQAQYTDYLSNYLFTHNGDSRGGNGPGTQHDMAQTNIYNEFVADGLTTSLQACNNGMNVIGVKLGAVHPNDIYIVGAHYDSVSAGPGADDNASGTAGVMAAAKAMKNLSFEDTVIFCAFDREEQYMVGSIAYYNAHSIDNVKGMISLDMIAYNYSGTPNVAYLYGRTPSIQTALAGSLANYGITAYTNGPLDGSDQYAWDINGKPACLLIENHGANPYYHQPGDSVDSPGYIDYAYATKMTKGAVDFLATGAVVVPEPATLSVLAFGVGGLLLKRRRAA